MDANNQVVEDWSNSKELKTSILAIFFDFLKSFDLVAYEILLQKLIENGFPH